MKTLFTKSIIHTFNITIAIAAIASAGATLAAESTNPTVKLLEANFDTRQVVQVDAGDFHFKPGQVAPIHTHAAPAVGYVVKGEIIYQIEGEKQIVLREGDVFYEPAGPRILRFDNASAIEEAIFVDFNLQQEGEPFIVFENPPTEAIDRRTLPTTKLDAKKMRQVNIFKTDLNPNESFAVTTSEPLLGIVAHGVVMLKRKGEAAQKVLAGGTFSVPVVGTKVEFVNASDEIPAKVISFKLR